MPEDDKKFEAALAGFFHRESRDDAARLLCPDPELLAAYHQRALSPEESQTTQLHVAGCARCQEVLAQLEATDNLPLETSQRDTADSLRAIPQLVLGRSLQEVPRRSANASMPPSSRSQRQWRWIAPAGAIAAGLLLWIGYREMRPAQKSPATAVQVAENRQQADVPAAPPPPSSEIPKPAARKREQPPTAGNFTNKIDRSDSSKVLDNLELSARSYSQLQATESVEVQADAAAKAIVGENAAASSPIPPQVSDSKNKSASAAAPAPPAKVEEKRAMAYGDETVETDRLKMRVTSAARQITNPILILAPDASAMWRLGAAGSIEFSSTGGGEWQHQASGVSAELISGFAPQKNVCWIVGRSGTVLLTTDSGATWRKIPSPTSNDLGGVHATDALHATVWEIGGQKKFETADAGQTWKPVAGQ